MSSPEDALKAYNLAMSHSKSGNLEAALKWARKACSIDPGLTKAKVLLISLEKGHMPGHEEGSSTSSAKTNGSAAGSSSSSSSEGLKRRTTAAAASNGSGQSTPQVQREYTQEQMTIVTRVNKAGRENDFYGVLMLSKTDNPDDNAVKKGYRKLALQLHPDKNGAPGADEAFKIVSKAFTILSDPDKRAVYDRYGGDPDSRATASSSAGRAAQGFRYAGGPGMHGMGAEIDPNDLFNMFFSGGMGSGFGGTTFSFGGPGGIHMHQFGGGVHPAFRRQTRQGGARQAGAGNDSTPVLLQLMPLLLLGLFSLLSFAPTLFSTPDPQYVWSPQGSYRTARQTPEHSVKYYVDQAQWKAHPWVLSASKINDAAAAGDPAVQAEANRATSRLQGFERRVENQYKNVLYNDCERRREYQARRVAAAQGTLFGIGADREAEQRIRAEQYDSCDRLRDFGIEFGLTI